MSLPSRRPVFSQLFSIPMQPLEVMFGKILPLTAVGYIQPATILILAKFIFKVPLLGSTLLVLV